MFAIEGRATSVVDGKPICCIVVGLWTGNFYGESARIVADETDNDGWFRLTSLPSECKSPSLQAAWDPGDGYRVATTSADGRFSAAVRCTGDVQRIDVTLLPGW